MDSIIEHLSNLKFYADYKRSPAKNFDQFTAFIDSGSPEDFEWSTIANNPKIERFSYTDPLEDAEFEKNVEDFIEKEESQKQIPKDDLEDWFRYTTSIIEGILERENAYILLDQNPVDTLKRLLSKHDRLKNFINNSDDDFYIYTSWMQQRPPSDFFKIFSEKEENIENLPLINCFPRIFVDCKAYSFFSELQSENLNQADQNYLYHQMKKDKLIHYEIDNKEYENFINSRLTKPIEIYSEGKLSSSTTIFKEEYKRKHISWY